MITNKQESLDSRYFSEIQQEWLRGFVPDVFRKLTLDHYPMGTDQHQEAVQAAIQYREWVREGVWRPLVIYGPPGTGKTMLASAVFNEIAGSVPARTSIDDAQQAGTADNVVWLNSAELVKRFRRDDHDSVTPAQKWHHAATAFMAVLDDLDKHPAGEWGNDLLALVDARVWRQRFPTIITMNLDPPALARRYGQAGAPIVDRLNRSGAMWIRLDERPKPS